MSNCPLCLQLTNQNDSMCMSCTHSYHLACVVTSLQSLNLELFTCIICSSSSSSSSVPFKGCSYEVDKVPFEVESAISQNNDSLKLFEGSSCQTSSIYLQHLPELHFTYSYPYSRITIYPPSQTKKIAFLIILDFYSESNRLVNYLLQSMLKFMGQDDLVGIFPTKQWELQNLNPISDGLREYLNEKLGLSQPQQNVNQGQFKNWIRSIRQQIGESHQGNAIILQDNSLNSLMYQNELEGIGISVVTSELNGWNQECKRQNVYEVDKIGKHLRKWMKRINISITYIQEQSWVDYRVELTSKGQMDVDCCYSKWLENMSMHLFDESEQKQSLKMGQDNKYKCVIRINMLVQDKGCQIYLKMDQDVRCSIIEEGKGEIVYRKLKQGSEVNKNVIDQKRIYDLIKQVGDEQFNSNSNNNNNNNSVYYSIIDQSMNDSNQMKYIVYCCDRIKNEENEMRKRYKYYQLRKAWLDHSPSFEFNLNI